MTLPESVQTIEQSLPGRTLAALRPTASTPNAAVTTTTASWDSGGAHEIAVPADAEFADVYVSADAFLVFSASADDPAADGCQYVGPGVYRLPCFGATHLHVKRASADVTVRATFYGAA